MESKQTFRETSVSSPFIFGGGEGVLYLDFRVMLLLRETSYIYPFKAYRSRDAPTV